MFRKGLLIGAAAGYVLGARAGRGRYEQIVRAWNAIRTNRNVRRAASWLASKAGQGARRVRHSRDGDRRVQANIPPGYEAELANLAGPADRP